MLFLSYAQWSLFDAPWVGYLRRCVAIKRWQAQQVFLLIDAEQGIDQGLYLREHIQQIVYKESQLHALVFQPLRRNFTSIATPVFLESEKMAIWEKSSNAHCINQFFLGYHPWFGSSDTFEAIGDRWWPTRAWWRGWIWNMNLNNSPATIMVLV